MSLVVISAFVNQYWYVFALIIVALAIYIVNNFLKGATRTIALKYLLAAEKVVFTTTESKLSVVVDAAYKALPALAKPLVSPAAFELIITEAYDEVRTLVDKLSADPSVPVQKSTATVKPIVVNGKAPEQPVETVGSTANATVANTTTSK